MTSVTPPNWRRSKRLWLRFGSSVCEQPLESSFDAARLQETHRRIFGGVYEWAGKFRKNTGTTTTQRETGHLGTYGDSAYIEAGLAAAFEKLNLEKFLRRLTPAAFGFGAAHFYGEFDAVHPFREGNSRTLRQFFSDVAKQAGYKINWTAASTTELQRQHFDSGERPWCGPGRFVCLGAQSYHAS